MCGMVHGFLVLIPALYLHCDFRERGKGAGRAVFGAPDFGFRWRVPSGYSAEFLPVDFTVSSGNAWDHGSARLDRGVLGQ